MNNIEFNAYLTDVLRLVRTMVIKIEAVALRDNSVQEAAGYPVSSDKRTWRYYMNLNGDYHPTDEVMKVISLDTGSEIIFNKANLVQHLATMREYSAGGYFFNRLAEAYPAQSDLIRGILAPIPYEETIEAEDYKILKYNRNLVGWNEDQLIPELQKVILALVGQIFDHEYRWTDNLMLPMGIMTLYADIVKAVLTIRLEGVGTRYVHDFYIWSHIDSFGDFSKYKASLSRYQTMWLYRNIAWLKNNPGQQYTFDKLMTNLLTHAGIPLAKYDLVENTETQIEDLTPTPLYRKLQLNLVDDYGRYAQFIDTEAMTLKQQYLAKENFDQTAIWYDDALKKGKYSLHSELPTKALESAMADYTNRHIDTQMSVVFNEWIYLTAKGYFKGKILTTDPKTGRQVRLPVGDAYHLWRYLVDLSRGQAGINICPAYYQNVLKVKAPSATEIIAIGGNEYVKPFLANDIRQLWIPVQTFIAPEWLMNYSVEVYRIMWKHKKLYSQFRDLNKHARVKHATEMMYTSGQAVLTDVKTYKQLLDRYEMDFTEYSPEEARNYAWEIFKRITGWDSNSNPSLRIQQNALIDIMLQLSSYTIHVIREMDDGLDMTELQNETFVGDSAWRGDGNKLTMDVSGIKLDAGTAINMNRDLAMEATLRVPEVWYSDNDASSNANFAQYTTPDVLKVVDLGTDPYETAIRFHDNSYLLMLPSEFIALPETDYDRLVFRDLDV